MTLKELKNISHEDYVQYVKQRISGETSTLVLQDGREAAVKKALPKVKVLKEKTVESGFIENEPTDEEMTEELIALIEQRAATYGMIARTTDRKSVV